MRKPVLLNLINLQNLLNFVSTTQPFSLTQSHCPSPPPLGSTLSIPALPAAATPAFAGTAVSRSSSANPPPRVFDLRHLHSFPWTRRPTLFRFHLPSLPFAHARCSMHRLCVHLRSRGPRAVDFASGLRFIR
jgi:hypothetical protein